MHCHLLYGMSQQGIMQPCIYQDSGSSKVAQRHEQKGEICM